MLLCYHCLFGIPKSNPFCIILVKNLAKKENT